MILDILYNKQTMFLLLYCNIGVFLSQKIHSLHYVLELYKSAHMIYSFHLNIYVTPLHCQVSITHATNANIRWNTIKLTLQLGRLLRNMAAGTPCIFTFLWIPTIILLSFYYNSAYRTLRLLVVICTCILVISPWILIICTCR